MGEAAPREARPPCSNTGVSQVAALVDYLSVSTALGLLTPLDGLASEALPRNEADFVAAIAAQAFGLSQRAFNRLYPGTAIEAMPFEKKAFQGYTFSAPLRVRGVLRDVGVIAVGGNRGTLHISLSGAGCLWLRDWAGIAENLQRYRAVITRVDVAIDDFDGEYLNVRALALRASQGGFKRSRGAPPAMRLVDDLGTGKGCSLYVGKKGAKELNVYDKGKEQGIADSPHVRAELRLWSKARAIPYETLTNPGAYVRGEYPILAALLPEGDLRSTKIIHNKAEASVEAMERWLRTSAGKSLDFMRRAYERAGIPTHEIINDLAREGTPRRFAGMPEEVALAKVEKKAGYSGFDFERFSAEETVPAWHDYEGANA